MRFDAGSSQRRGLTLVEVIVALAIAIFLAAILIPALQRSREEARKTQCKNNLKQLGMAIHNYIDSYSVFPFGYVLGQTGTYQGWGWGLAIQPMLESSPYYNSIQFRAGLQTEYARPHMNPEMSVFRCPADLGTPRVQHAAIVSRNVQNGIVTTATVDAAGIFSRSNYFAMAGYLQAEVGGITFDEPGQPPASGPHLNAGSLGHFGTPPSPGLHYCDSKNFGGIFGQNSSTRPQDIKEGLSNTLMMGERATPANNAKGAIGHGTWLGVPDCTTAAGLAMTLGDTSIKMNSAFDRQAETTGFGSRHWNGATFLLADGSVRFLSDKIWMAVYRDLSTISDGRKEPGFE